MRAALASAALLSAAFAAAAAPAAPAAADWISAAERALFCNAEAAPFPPRSTRSIRWLHVPKTGTSFMNTVWHHACDVPRDASAADFEGFYEREFAKRYPPARYCPHLIDHSPATHKPIGAAEWAAHAPARAFVTMLREPKSRAFSAFRHGHHCIQDCSPENPAVPACVAVRDPARRAACKPVRAAASAREYAELAAVRGCAVRMVAGRPCNDAAAPSAAELALALDRLREGFGFVGLVEEWRLSVCLFHRLYGGAPLPVESQAVRVQSAGATPLPTRPRFFRLMPTDPHDGELYAAAVDTFRRRVRNILAGLPGSREAARDAEPRVGERDAA